MTETGTSVLERLILYFWSTPLTNNQRKKICLLQNKAAETKMRRNMSKEFVITDNASSKKFEPRLIIAKSLFVCALKPTTWFNLFTRVIRWIKSLLPEELAIRKVVFTIAPFPKKSVVIDHFMSQETLHDIFLITAASGTFSLPKSQWVSWTDFVLMLLVANPCLAHL